jgi:DNA-binding LacI/PurR family transcriptional regulator
MSDELALGAPHAASRTGRTVPGAVAITGWNDSDAAAPAGLTTLRQSLRDQGRRCAHIAPGHSRSAAQDPADCQVIPRASTRRLERRSLSRGSDLSRQPTRHDSANKQPLVTWITCIW